MIAFFDFDIIYLPYLLYYLFIVDIDECDKRLGPSGKCGGNAICSNSPGGFSCACQPGYTGDPNVNCYDINECTTDRGICGREAKCQNIPGAFKCTCFNGAAYNPLTKSCGGAVACTNNEQCPGNAICSAGACSCPEPNVGPNCEDPCDTATCFPNAQCFVQNAIPMCRCLPGFQLLPVQRACIDINECESPTSPCGQGAFCENTIGSFRCKCPSGLSGDPSRGCSPTSQALTKKCRSDSQCRSGETCITGTGECVCRRGYDVDPLTGKCQDVNECLASAKPVCGAFAVCKNLPGSYECECPQGYSGNPFSQCVKCTGSSCGCQPPYVQVGNQCQLAGCASDADCASQKASCVKITGGVSYCACPPGFQPGPDNVCTDVNECTNGLGSPCGRGATCTNTEGSFQCACPSGTSGDAHNGICQPLRLRCTTNSQCRANEKCMPTGECVCLPPFFTDVQDGNRCRSPCDRFICGLNAECTPTNPPQCLCKAGTTGNPLTGCEDVDECRNNPCGPKARCLNEPGSYKCQCPKGTRGDPYTSGCVGSGRTECNQDEDCPGQLACENSVCVNPCSSLPCGDVAICIPERHAAWCRCKSGFKEDKTTGKCVSECQNMICGDNAQCIVSPEGPTCVCLEGMVGNPFPGGNCNSGLCSARNPCPSRSQTCENGRCVDTCDNKICGLNARCDPDSRECICAEGFVGDAGLVCMPPIGPPVCSPGCGPHSHCAYGTPNKCVCDLGFGGNPYIGCQPTSSAQIVGSCSTLKCGQNAICSMASGIPQCICTKGYTGNPFSNCLDIDECIAPVCGENAVCLNTPGSYDCRCKDGFIGNPYQICTVENDEERDDLCKNQKCGPNAVCNLGQCLCAPGFKGDDPYDAAVGCSAISQCTYHTDCGYNEICTVLPQTVHRQCVDACSRVNCGPNAYCVTDNHHMSCLCNEGFSGDPNDLRSGCREEKGCQSAKDCPAGLLCQVNIYGKRSCLDPCQIMSCPDGEKCQVINNKPVCGCAEGHTKNKLTGVCAVVSGCQNDNDCRPSEACREGTFGTKTCVDVCSQVQCPPQTSVCVADNHRANCKCRNGFGGNPDNRIGCTEALTLLGCTNDVQCPEDKVCRLSQGRKQCIAACSALQCGPGAICTARNHVGKCTCPPGLFTGDPYGGGCKNVNCLENDDCPSDKYCDRLSYTCLNVCKSGICGDGAVCTVENHQHKCTCPPDTQPAPAPEVKCEKLRDGEKCDVGQCQVSCFTNQQCPDGQTCKNGLCAEGCADHRDCPGQNVCVQGKCANPCAVRETCGPNSKCEARNKAEHCSCPKGFAGVPTAIQGCVRIPDPCSGKNCPKGHRCLNGFCMWECKLHADCARGEQCVDGMCLKLCHSDKNCLQGEICMDKFCRPGCNVNGDCRNGETCNNGNCECSKGFISTPNGCQDINECQGGQPSCPPGTVCENKLGTFICKCPPGTNGDPRTGCTKPNQCFSDALCPDTLACVLDPLSGRNKCKNPCEFAFCTQGASCQTINHKPFCSCPPGHRGDPTDPNIGCYKVECESNNDCAPTKSCDKKQQQCVDPCNGVTCGKKGSCRTENHKPICYCQPGYQPSNGQCVDIDECTKPTSCHSTAICRNSPGSFSCSCPEGSVGDAKNSGCKPRSECQADRDCPAASACREGRCVDPCIGQCGQGAICEVVGHQASCSCPARTSGNPRTECRQLECVENTECPVGRSCVQNKCVDACTLAGVCGANAVCTVLTHTPLCSCSPGFTGDPTVGCSPILTCASQAQCPANLICAFGVCSPPCSSLRDCLEGQACVNDKCVNRCTKNNQCPEFHECRGGVCALAEKCRSNGDCSGAESCTTALSNLGQRECRNVCEGPVICGRNAVCQPSNHR